MNEYLKILIIVFILLIFIEFLLFFTVNTIKKDFQWIITNKDEFPIKSLDELNKFYQKNYNFLTGWDKKKNSKSIELLDNKKTFYKINAKGFRNTKFSHKKSIISVFGDSYAFCRYVNDKDTWECKLEDKIQSCVRNYGVGNFGLDQSYIKFKSIKLPKSTKLIIFAFVPETISRVNSYWKHYSEFGNKFGFKPIYKLENNKLILNKNLLVKNKNLNFIKKIIPILKKKDIFYERRFKKYIFKFPYIFSYLKFLNRNNTIFFNIILFKFFKILNLKNKNRYYKSSYNKIIKENILDANRMYNEFEFKTHLFKMITMINTNVNKNKKQCLFVIIPQLYDLHNMIQNKNNYSNFFNEINKLYKINFLDLTNIMINKKKIEKFYLEDRYGGHLSIKGNKFVANEIYKYLNKNKII